VFNCLKTVVFFSVCAGADVRVYDQGHDFSGGVCCFANVGEQNKGPRLCGNSTIRNCWNSQQFFRRGAT